MKRTCGVLLLLLAGCGGDERFAKTWDGVRSTIESPQKVEAFRIQGAAEQGGRPTSWDYSTWKVTAGPVAVDAATSRRLASLFLDAKSYYRGPPKACIPIPGVRLEYTDAHRKVTVLLCLDCNNVMVSSSDGKGGGDDYDPAAPALVAIVKQLFPKDPEIQAFK